VTRGFVAADGAALVDPAGLPLVLRGVNIGGWLLMEGFINGFPGNESAARRHIRSALGEARAARFMDRFLDTWYAEDDVRYLASLGFNCVRIPVNYRHLEDDLRPFELRVGAFVQLDRVLELHARHGLYTIIDLHAAQGWQNHAWHSDNPGRVPLLWEQRQFQDRVTWLWGEIARRYRDDPWVAGYNLLNEPADVEGGLRQAALYRRLADAIRAFDPDHMLVLDGNTYAREFDGLGDPIPNTLYALHQYPDCGRAGAGSYPGPTEGRHWDREAVETEFLERSAWMRERGLPVLVGEFGPVYEDEAGIDESRLRVLEDQLSIYEQHHASWTVWTYKDVGVQGLMRIAPDSPWMRLLGPQIDRTKALGAQYWAVPPAVPKAVYPDVYALVAREFASLDWYPWGPEREAWAVVGENLIAGFLGVAFEECFRGMDDEALDGIADSFRFDRCVERRDLVERLMPAA
jgi:aryl-phospho-beta-D-glucosidase BglC (GH1 family)